MLKAMGAALTLGFLLALANSSPAHAATSVKTLTSCEFIFHYGATENTWTTTLTNTWTAAGLNSTTKGNFRFSPAPVGPQTASWGPTFSGGVLADGWEGGMAAATYTEFPTGYNNQQGSGQPVPAQSLPITAQYLGPAPADVDASNPGYKLRLELFLLGIHGVSASNFSTGSTTLQWSEVTDGHAQSSPPSATLNKPPYNPGWLAATNYTQLAWDAPDYDFTLASLGDAVTRTFRVEYAGTDPYAVIDGMTIRGRVILSYNAMPNSIKPQGTGLAVAWHGDRLETTTDLAEWSVVPEADSPLAVAPTEPRRFYRTVDEWGDSWTDAKTIEMDGMKVVLSQPRLVARSKGYLWFPTLVHGEQNEVMALLSDIPDVLTGGPTGLITRSADGGAWSDPEIGVYADCAPLRLGNGDLLLLSNYLYPAGNGSYSGCSLIAAGSRGVRDIPGGVTITDWPRAIRPGPHGLAGFGFTGQTVALTGGGYLATLYGHFENAQRYSLVAAHSLDGRNWSIRSVIADENCPLPGAEGPSETALCRLKDGRLMCVFRNSGGAAYGQSWSEDEGMTWTTPVAMAQASVQPSLAVMPDGTVLLSGGRPGIHLWINANGTGNGWQAVDVRAHHNEFIPAEPIGDFPETTSYGEILAVDDKHLLLVYDRVPHGWGPIPQDSPESNSVWVVRVGIHRN